MRFSLDNDTNHYAITSYGLDWVRVRPLILIEGCCGIRRHGRGRSRSRVRPPSVSFLETGRNPLKYRGESHSCG